MVLPSPSSLRFLSRSSDKGMSVVNSFVNDPLSSGLVWVRFFKACYKVGLTQRGAVALLGVLLVARSSPSGLIRFCDYVVCVGLLSGFGDRTCDYYLASLVEKGFINRVKRGQYTLTDKAKSAETTILGKAEECIKLRNEVLAKYSK